MVLVVPGELAVFAAKLKVLIGDAVDEVVDGFKLSTFPVDTFVSVLGFSVVWMNDEDVATVLGITLPKTVGLSLALVVLVFVKESAGKIFPVFSVGVVISFPLFKNVLAVDVIVLFGVVPNENAGKLVLPENPKPGTEDIGFCIPTPELEENETCLLVVVFGSDIPLGIFCATFGGVENIDRFCSFETDVV